MIENSLPELCHIIFNHGGEFKDCEICNSPNPVDKIRGGRNLAINE